VLDDVQFDQGRTARSTPNVTTPLVPVTSSEAMGVLFRAVSEIVKLRRAAATTLAAGSRDNGLRFLVSR
jgi:hypothetical protein